jgi:galactokinase
VRESGAGWRVVAADRHEQIEYDFGRPVEELPRWARYACGVISLIAPVVDAPPMDIAFASDVPIGAGLSSSAALEVAIATLIESGTGCEMDPLERATLCQRAEHEFAGVPCGIMDQMASVFGKQGHAMLIDCRERTVTQIPLWDEDDTALIVIDSGVRHDLADGAYARRRAACEEAAKGLGAELRDVTGDDLQSAAALLGVEVLRCARHVVSENQRVLHASESLRAVDAPLFGALMSASHESLRVDMRVSCAELDQIVDAALGVAGVLGARMTGGGFGGCAIALVERGAVGALQERMKNLGRPCRAVTSGCGARGSRP